MRPNLDSRPPIAAPTRQKCWHTAQQIPPHRSAHRTGEKERRIDDLEIQLTCAIVPSRCVPIFDPQPSWWWQPRRRCKFKPHAVRAEIKVMDKSLLHHWGCREGPAAHNVFMNSINNGVLSVLPCWEFTRLQDSAIFLLLQ